MKVTYAFLKSLEPYKPIEIECEKDRFKIYVMYDPQEPSFKFTKHRYENKHIIRNHVEISEFALEDSPDEADKMIKQAIDKLRDTNECWNIERNNEIHKIDCNKCK